MMQRSEEHTSELQSPCNLVCRLLLEKKKKNKTKTRESLTDTAAGQRRHRVAARVHRPSSPRTAHPCRGSRARYAFSFFFFFNDTATTEIYTLSLHDALPISVAAARCRPFFSGSPHAI